jgi:excisionase family DNA binding protein
MPTELAGATVYTVEDVMAQLGLSTRTVHQYFREGRLQGRKIGRRWYITPEDLQAFITGRGPDDRATAPYRAIISLYGLRADIRSHLAQQEAGRRGLRGEAGDAFIQGALWAAFRYGKLLEGAMDSLASPQDAEGGVAHAEGVDGHAEEGGVSHAK